MEKLSIKNFGPIKEGLSNEPYFIFDKVTLFIGNQATGKSSVAKLFSTFSWLEKSLFRQEIKIGDITEYNRFVKVHCAYQGLKNYFNDNTEIVYEGRLFRFTYENKSLNIEENENEYFPPKIMYVPAERNFLSIVDSPRNLKYLPPPLYTFLDEYERAKSELKNILDIPINNISYEYQKQNKISYIKGNNYKLRLHEASSGIQSLLPLYLVSRNIASHIKNGKAKTELTVEQLSKLRKRVEGILKNPKIEDEVRSVVLEKLSSIYKNVFFINIVEEMEQNLYPDSQKKLLYELLKLNSYNKNKLLLTTHSPYILNYLTIAMKGGQIAEKIQGNNNLIKELEQVISLESCIAPSKVNVYQFSEDGTVHKLKSYNEIISDNNYLNNSLFDTNQIFDKLLDIEEQLI